MSSRPTLLLDGDDTLWSTQPLYEDAKEALYALVAKSSLDAGAARAEFDPLDLANVQRFGFSTDRFPTSMWKMVSVPPSRPGPARLATASRSSRRPTRAARTPTDPSRRVPTPSSGPPRSPTASRPAPPRPPILAVVTDAPFPEAGTPTVRTL